MTAAPFTVNAKPRTAAGKGGARRVRSEGSIPAIAYGRELEAMSLSVAPKDILTVLASEHGQNSVLELSVEGAKKLLVMIKEYSYHPLKRNLLHVDFVEVKLDRPVDVEIPLFTTGKAEGVTKGGLLRQVFRTLPVRCLPDRIPLKLEADATALLASTTATHAAAHRRASERPSHLTRETRPCDAQANRGLRRPSLEHDALLLTHRLQLLLARGLELLVDRLGLGVVALSTQRLAGHRILATASRGEPGSVCRLGGARGFRRCTSAVA